MKEPLFVVHGVSGELAGARFCKRPVRLGRGIRSGDVENGNGLEDRAKGFGLAQRTPIEDTDPEALIAAGIGAAAAKLEEDGLILIAHPFVGAHLRQAGEHETGRDSQGGRLGGHLGHDRERQDRKAFQ